MSARKRHGRLTLIWPLVGKEPGAQSGEAGRRQGAPDGKHGWPGFDAHGQPGVVGGRGAEMRGSGGPGGGSQNPSPPLPH